MIIGMGMQRPRIILAMVLIGAMVILASCEEVIPKKSGNVTNRTDPEDAVVYRVMSPDELLERWEGVRRGIRSQLTGSGRQTNQRGWRFHLASSRYRRILGFAK